MGLGRFTNRYASLVLERLQSSEGGVELLGTANESLNDDVVEGPEAKYSSTCHYFN